MKSHLEYQPMDGGDRMIREGESAVQEGSGGWIEVRVSLHGRKAWFFSLSLLCTIRYIHKKICELQSIAIK